MDQETSEEVLAVITTPKSMLNKSSLIGKIIALIQENKGKTAALFTHCTPDPDALGSLLGMSYLLSKYDIQSTLYWSGAISHPQNRSMVNLLQIDLVPVEEYKEHDLNILVDTVPANAGTPKEKNIKFDLIVDHHKDLSSKNKSGELVLNLKAGSTCGTIYYLMEELGCIFNLDSDSDLKIATAMMIGITTDTENLMSDDTTELEFHAWSKLHPFKDPTSLKQIVNFERPKFWTENKAEAVTRANIREGVGVVGMGVIASKHRDMIADMADEMANWEDVNTSIVFAIVDGNRIEGSVRTKSSSISVPSLCNNLGGKFGQGGGKLGKGAYKYELGGAGIEEDDTIDIKKMACEFFNKKEEERIFKIFKNR